MAQFNAKQFLQDSCISDAHKDAYGHRPRQWQYEQWLQMDEAELTAVYDRIIVDVEAAIESENEGWRHAAIKFEAHIVALMQANGIDRATAIKWDMQAEGITEEDTQFYGMDWYGHHHGLRMGYFNERGAA